MQRGKASNSSSEACFVSVPKSKPGITMQKPRNMNAECHGQISTNPVTQYAKEMPHRDSGASASGATRGVLPHCSPSRPLCPGSPWAPPSARAFSRFPKQRRCLQALTLSPPGATFSLALSWGGGCCSLNLHILPSAPNSLPECPPKQKQEDIWRSAEDNLSELQIQTGKPRLQGFT